MNARGLCLLLSLDHSSGFKEARSHEDIGERIVLHAEQCAGRVSS